MIMSLWSDQNNKYQRISSVALDTLEVSSSGAFVERIFPASGAEAEVTAVGSETELCNRFNILKRSIYKNQQEIFCHSNHQNVPGIYCHCVQIMAANCNKLMLHQSISDRIT